MTLIINTKANAVIQMTSFPLIGEQQFKKEKKIIIR